VIQSIWLTIVAIVFSAIFVNTFSYVAALVLGFIPFLYLKKSLKKDILKVNVLSSVVAFVVLLIVHYLLLQVKGPIASEGLSAGTIVPFVSIMFLSVFTFNGFLSGTAIFIGLFNVPFLIYFFFGKERKIAEQVARA